MRRWDVTSVVRFSLKRSGHADKDGDREERTGRTGRASEKSGKGGKGSMAHNGREGSMAHKGREGATSPDESGPLLPSEWRSWRARCIIIDV